MASDAQFVAYVVEQMSGAGEIVAKKMFGEYGIYCDGKIVALVCDDQVFLKPTPEGRALLGGVSEAPPYPGGKPYLVIDALLDDRDRLREVVAVTARHLPAPKPKKPKKAAQKSP